MIARPSGSTTDPERVPVDDWACRGLSVERIVNNTAAKAALVERTLTETVDMVDLNSAGAARYSLHVTEVRRLG
jgi:hypothetical protein